MAAVFYYKLWDKRIGKSTVLSAYHINRKFNGREDDEKA